MAQEHHHNHHIFNQHEEEQKAAEEEFISETAFSNEYTGSNYTESVEVVSESTIDYEKEEEHLGETGAIAASALGLHEKHEGKKDPEHTHRHKIEEEVAVVGAGGCACKEKKEVEEEEEAEGKKNHHLF